MGRLRRRAELVDQPTVKSARFGASHLHARVVELLKLRHVRLRTRLCRHRLYFARVQEVSLRTSNLNKTDRYRRDYKLWMKGAKCREAAWQGETEIYRVFETNNKY